MGTNGDGTEYASIARNMSEGLGTFWAPYLDDTNEPVHWEHPPLIYWIQSIFFRMFGDGLYFEGIYGFGIALVILYLAAMFWQRVRRDFQLQVIGSWWPLVLLISLPVATFLIFALLETYFAYRSMAGGKSTVIYAIATGLTVYLGFIAMGPVALFAFAVPTIGCLTIKPGFSRAAASTLLAMVIFAACFLLTGLLFPESMDFWKFFMKAQIFRSLASTRGGGDSYFRYIERLISNLIVPFGLTGMIMLILKTHFRNLKVNRHAAFFLLIALAGCLPFFVSKRQHLRYILHSLPFFILSLAFVTDNIAEKVESIIGKKRKIRLGFVVTALFFFMVSIGAMVYRKDEITRADAFFEDLYLRDIPLTERSIVTIYPKEMIMDDYLFVWMQRYFKVSVTGEMGGDYLLVDKKSGFEIPEGYEKMHREPTRKYILYKRIVQ
jgi:4-amino-4-deoxy-L-arabinose transferase-like glycosyltransferase